jgi:hypothetical protein
VSALAGRVDAAIAGVGVSERRALERREADGADYAVIAAELGVKREQVADLLVAARLEIAAAIDGTAPPARLVKQCGPARRVVAAQQDGEAVGARDLDRAGAHIEGCEACQAARVALQQARLACRTWSTTAPAPPVGAAPAVTAAGRRSRLAAVVAVIALILVALVVALGGGGDEDGVPAPAAPPVGQGSADADGEDVVPPPGDEFCLPDEPGCP